ncbi:MAG TPA: intradiol ring-cleavage dioxygenase [Baekduia sp.]|jgi:protocatechuate 3,4-dioxygenase beta subunit|nr:intradiol ring-cleavage dioxygenase [Baekduia sp.]
MPTAHDDRYRPTRRRVLRDLGDAGLLGAALAAAGSGLLAGSPLAATPALAAACTLTAEQEEGPYYLDLEKIRRNVTEGRAGLRLDLEITIVDSTTCRPIEGVAVDIWHCDAGGVYSGFSAEGTKGRTYLRGVQLTDAGGTATFRTIYPGWYQGRATHIHLKAHVGGKSGASTYSGGHVAHTGQVFFSDTITDRVAKLSPYTTDKVVRTRNAADRVYTQQGGAGLKLALTRHRAGTITSGFKGAITLGLDPSATPAAAGGGGGGGR